MSTAPRRPGATVDDRLLALRHDDDPCVATYELAPHLVRPDGALYGGTAMAAVSAAAELATGRPTLWATVQFAASARVGDVIESRTELTASGRTISQFRTTGTVDGRLVYAALGSTATSREDGAAGTGLVMPAVPPPDECGPLHRSPVMSLDTGMGQNTISEHREAPLAQPRDRGHMALWTRLHGEAETTATTIGFLADMVPLAASRAAGIQGAGTSLDNTMRFGPLVDTEWFLLEMEGQLADGGYGHGNLRCWAPDGTLMAVGSQTARLFSFESFAARFAEGAGS